MGELLLAQAESAGGVRKLVAIKRIRSEYASDQEFVTMFINEARLAATLDHPNVVRTYDLVEDGGSFFMVMEYLHGESLGQLLNSVVSTKARVPLRHIVAVMLGVAAGLHCAHERCGVDGRPLDIVHRDLSPGNVFITYEGGVKLLDFGIAKATSRTSITIGPSRKGKVSYMSPEQCVGREIDRRSDIFALGVVTWELSTGRRLFTGDNEFAIMNQITTTDAPSPATHVPELPPALCEIIGRALRRDREERFQTAMELHDAVEAFARTHGLLPSNPELGRYLEQTCGFREYPSAEPSEEFAEPGRATLVVHEPARVSSWRRWSVPLALLGGVGVGAMAMAATSGRNPATPASTPATVVSPAAAEDAEPLAPVADPPTDAAPTSDPAMPPAAGDAATPPAEPATETPSADGAQPEPAPTKTKKRRRSPRKKRESSPTKTESGKPDRGVDGILPGH